MFPTPWGPLPYWLVYPIVLAFGLSLGSFANVLIYRLPREESLTKPPSRCPNCGRLVRPLENIPVLSWVILRGKCKGCAQPISVRYPIVELVSGIIALITVQIFGLTFASIAYGLLFIALFALVIIDLEHWLLPFAITIPMTLLGLAGSLFFDLRSFTDSLLGMVVGFTIFMIMLLGGKYIMRKDALGGGDVVFGLMAGSFLGWKLTILMIFMASFLGTLIALPLLFMGKELSGKAVPFGPFLAVAMVVCIFAGDNILSWYLGLIKG